MDDSSIRRRVSCGSLVISLVFTCGAFAQTAEQDSNDEDRLLTTVTVTAQKRDQDLQDVPITITAIGSQLLRDAGVRDIKDLTLLTSGLVVTSTSSEVSTTARIRGIGTVGDNIGLESSVGVVIDGVYRPRNGVGFGDLGELERIEVLKGPQGTVFGKNTSAGVINVISKRPDFEGGANAELTATNFNGYEAAASINGPLIDDKLAGRFYAAYRRRDGLYDVSTGDGTRADHGGCQSRCGCRTRAAAVHAVRGHQRAVHRRLRAAHRELLRRRAEQRRCHRAAHGRGLSRQRRVASRGPVRPRPVRESFGRAGDARHGPVRGAQFRNVVRQDHLDHRVAQFRIDDRTGRRLQHGRRAVAKYRRAERQRVQPTVRGAAFLR